MLTSLKRSFFQDNDKLKLALDRISRAYVSQPKRTHCKLCSTLLGDQDFTKGGIPYHFCGFCGHINGGYQDTTPFCTLTSSIVDEINFNDHDHAPINCENYQSRIEKIYIPKAEFLSDALVEDGVCSNNLTHAVFGAGTGCYVSALMRTGVSRIVGYEVSEIQALAANNKFKDKKIIHHSTEDTITIAKHITAEVASLIGVLEQQQNPNKLLESLAGNQNVRYIYASIPMLSFSVFIEMFFNDVMPRQLSGDSFHLFTMSSLKWLEQEHGLTRIGEWWFGTDMFDLFRCISVMLGKTSGSRSVTEYWNQLFLPVNDPLQLEIDRRQMSSEVHLVWKIR
jgi:hypothetical protein